MATEYTEIDIEGICASGVEVHSWVHSGPVSVNLYGLVLEWMLNKIDIKLLEEYLENRRGNKDD